jgi:PKD repeat protein
MRAATTVAALLLVAACTTKSQEAPPLSGPSVLGTSLVLTVSPDVLRQDGASQSLVQIQAYDSNGQPLRSASLRVEIVVDGAITDFGSLSARNVVTDANGRASVTYTAPPAPVFSNITDTIVQIAVTPAVGDNANANPRTVNIRLTPPGDIGPPRSPFRVDFVSPGGVTVGNPATFQATVVDANGNDVTDQVAVFRWSFGDGDSATGRDVTHVYDDPATYPVTLTITDTLNRSNSVTHTVTVGQGQLPTAAFVISPSAAIIDQAINFNATGSTAEPGHRVVSWDWNFGDGSQGGGQVATHAYSQTGTYTVTLKVTDDVGRESAIVQQGVTVTTGNPTADFTFNPSAPRSGQQVIFDASASLAAPGRTIVSYSWAFGDGGSGTGQTVTHIFNLPAPGTTAQTYNVLLTVTDNAGKTHSVTKPVTVSPASVP